MGVIVNKENNENNELSRRINADLRAKVVAEKESEKEPDYVNDSEYIKDFKKTSKFGWVWIILIALAIVSLIFIFNFQVYRLEISDIIYIL